MWLELVLVSSELALCSSAVIMATSMYQVFLLAYFFGGRATRPCHHARGVKLFRVQGVQYECLVVGGWGIRERLCLLEPLPDKNQGKCNSQCKAYA